MQDTAVGRRAIQSERPMDCMIIKYKTHIHIAIIPHSTLQLTFKNHLLLSCGVVSKKTAGDYLKRLLKFSSFLITYPCEVTLQPNIILPLIKFGNRRQANWIPLSQIVKRFRSINQGSFSHHFFFFALGNTVIL